MNSRKIDDAIKKLHKKIWHAHGTDNRDALTLIPLLDPQVAAKIIGFELHYVETIYGDKVGYKAAGLMQRSNKRILVSTKFPPVEQRFTAAHELGHAIVHEDQSLFRDRPTSWQRGELSKRTPEEREADSFAAKFLMPQKLLRRQFESKFRVKTPYVFDENWAFHLSQQDPDSLLGDGDVDLARGLALASARTFNLKNFEPLHKQFHVSASAMAYRLIELDLVGNPRPLTQIEFEAPNLEGPHEPLFEPGLHFIDEADLEEHFAFPFSPAYHRDGLIKKLRKFLALIKTIGIPCEVWIDGSFATEKVEPRDIDLVVFMHQRDIERLPSQQRKELKILKDRGLLKERYTCDVYVECADDEVRKDYFVSTFGKDHVHAIEKGIPILRIGGQLRC